MPEVGWTHDHEFALQPERVAVHVIAMRGHYSPEEALKLAEQIREAAYQAMSSPRRLRLPSLHPEHVCYHEHCCR